MKRIYLLILCLCTTYQAQSQNFDSKRYDRRVAFINQFLENYKAAFAKMDIDYIEAIYSDEAIIITETEIIKPCKDEIVAGVRFGLNNKNEYKRIIENKEQYVKRLRKVFKDNVALNLSMSNVKIYPHNDYEDIFGVSFRQYWKSMDNSALLIEDDSPGYVFMMIDFKTGENAPMLHIRTWQPDSHIKRDGDIYQLYDFIIL